MTGRTIELRGVTKTFAGSDRPAVANLDLTFPAGETTALIGPSGCGKTTILRMVNRLVEPTSGTITIDGVDVRERPATGLRREIGYVIQQTGLFPHRTIAQNIATVPALTGWRRADIDTRVAELAELVGIDHALLSRYPAELSGGQQQRVGVARALAADPPVLLMDEPFAAVDPLLRTRLQRELLAVQERLHKTIVLVTHDLDEALLLGDRIAVLGPDGRLAQVAAPGDLLGAPLDEFVEDFLGDDRTIRRLGLLRLGDLDPDDLDAVPPEQSAGPSLTLEATLHDALEAILRSPQPHVAVRAADGSVLGAVTLDVIRGRLQV